MKIKNVAITGAGGVLCGSMAKALAAEGHNVALLDLNVEAAQKMADEINANGVGRAIALEANVLKKESLEAAEAKFASEFGKCDILINGAGGNSPKGTTTNEYFKYEDIDMEGVTSFFDLDPDGVDFVFKLNFLGTLLPSQVFMKNMVQENKGSEYTEGSGVVINISSMNAYTPLTKIPAYSGAKAAISNFTQWLAVHFAPAGIRVNAIAPGFFVTAQNQALLFNQDGTPTPRTGKILSQTPMNRFGKPEELLGALKFLIDDEAAGFITGIVIPVDGGFSAYSGV